MVDITNYAMLLTGQPLHAFDLDRVAGARLTVRRAARGRAGARRSTARRARSTARWSLIEDADGPDLDRRGDGRRALGGRSRDTTRVLMEVATWNGPNIHRTSWALGLRSEASGRFEKGLQPEQCMHAQARRHAADDRAVRRDGSRPGTIDVGGEPGRRPQRIRLREARVSAILGVPVRARAPGGDPARRSTSPRAAPRTAST